MRTRIKICCIASIEEARLAIGAGADALGLVGAMPSGPGPISDETIFEIAAFAPPPIAPFLLTSEQTADAISAHLRRTHTSTVQIVSQIDPAESAKLVELEPNVRRVQVVHVEGPSALDLMTAYAPHVHAFLLDSGRPSAGVPELGGTGRQHDWEVSAEFVRACALPVFLAGGLSAANAVDAITRVRPFGVDLCSGVRTNGRLDAAKLCAFVQAVRRADQELAPRGN
ncbi:phosphoribosylanthranilate isomerase [Methylocystis bryophila]|uniref:N-(5'-phosphoribosyl)anthranilate isomerase n=1 Tax=Methylocystis bryophila TaxID=655015 RepID=A0A1W6MVZ4_9HYPH|nr:phosphoribosylanthranilate isomerase [Methylocystis bryophila]ARN81696.1 N-(5'-phosphoribosyl)anthranilate isomerase [Methylocystis bryophila]BDV37745.1 N-(5'-phosphoribosyl)anthranilate isomerase [Methylocystis bryophila]